MTNRTLLAIAILVLGAGALPAEAQSVGQNTRVQFGIVRSAEEVSLDSSAPQNAMIGGMLGIASSSGGTARRVRNGIFGATAGAALTSATEGSRSGMSYTVEKADGSSSTIVTDQREIREGDCVAVEQAGQTANIRRTSMSYCDKANERAISAVAAHSNSEAALCEQAKQELADATAAEAVDLATRKVQLLCNG